MESVPNFDYFHSSCVCPSSPFQLHSSSYVSLKEEGDCVLLLCGFPTGGVYDKN